MQHKKRIMVMLLAVAICLCVVGCSPFSVNDEDLLTAPKLTGFMQPIQKALVSYISGKYNLKFPTSGDYRSAINVVQLDDDEENEAVAFYSTSSDNALVMHLAIIDRVDGQWKVTAEQKQVAGGVERLVLADMDQDGCRELVVGWNLYGVVEKKVGVYDYTGRSLTALFVEPYSTFAVCDLNNDFTDELLLLQLNTVTATSLARYYGFTTSGVVEKGQCALDGSVIGYHEPLVTKRKSGDFCVLVDAVKGAGLLTEVLVFSDGQLTAPLYRPDDSTSPVTMRSSAVRSQDFDGDGIAEVPLMTALPTGEMFSSNERAYLTAWSSFEDDGFSVHLYALMNYADGYYLTFDKAFLDSLTVVRDTKNRERIFYRYNPETGLLEEVLFRVRTVTRASYETSGCPDDTYGVIRETDQLVYLLSISPAGRTAGINENIITQAFNLLSEGKS